MTNIVNGQLLAEKINERTAKIVNKLKIKNIIPKLAVVLVGSDGPSTIYVKKKGQAAQKAGINFVLYKYPKNISRKKLITELQKIQKDKKLTGLIIQIPLPEHLYTEKVLNTIRPEIVIDSGIHFEDGKVKGDVNFIPVAKKAKFITPTPNGVGPITVAHLLANTAICAKYNNQKV